MRVQQKFKNLALAVSLICWSPQALWAAEEDASADDEMSKAATEDIPNVVVIGIRRQTKGMELLPEEHKSSPAMDGADLLRSVNGVSLGRFGGRGLEPTIRGQNQSRINVLIDGSYIHGGCPNRMDPPTSFASVNSYERITILKGVQSLRYGGGGSGGTLLFEREFEPGSKGFSGDLRIGASNNELEHDAAAALAFSGESVWLHVDVEDREAGNYEDGDGNEVRSAWDEESYNIAAGIRFREQDRLEAGYEHSETVDAFYPGAAMDAPWDEAKHMRLKYKGYDIGFIDQLTIETYSADVDHVMDNFSNRPLTAPMAMSVDSVSETDGSRIVAEFNSGDRTSWTVGIDYQANDRDATRFMGPNPDNVGMINSYMWPDTSLEQLGIFAEASYELSETLLLKGGLRYDDVSADAKKADLDPPPPPLVSANQLYESYYGVRHTSEVNENNWSGLLRLETTLSENLTLFAGLSRTMRTADVTERFLASNNPMSKMRWIGNPAIDPEQHRQFDLGFVWRNDTHRFDTVVFYDDAKDYMLRDRAHGQEGILKSDNASIYRNIDAEIYGIEAEWAWTITERLAANTSFAWVRSKNETDGRDIAQTPPLEGRVSLDYEAEKWSAGGALRWADNQTKVDINPMTGSGLDAAESPGWAVLDLYFSVELGALGMVHLGADNVLDRTYAEHLNRGNLDPFNPDPVRVNEPGRVIWATYQINF